MVIRTVPAFIVVILLFAPLATATSTGLTYMDSTWSSYEEDASSLIAINSNNTILAAVHNNEVVLFDVESLDKISSFTFDNVAAIEFSPNGSLLAVNKASSIQVKESIKLIDISSMTILEQSALADDRATDIAWSADGEVIAAPGPEGDVELYRRSDLSIKTTLHGVHNVDVSCIDYRHDGEYLITGDESGRYAIWDSQGVRQNEYREFGEELIDCKFSPDGQDILLLGSKGNLMSRTFAGSENHLTNVDGAKKVMFSTVTTRMQISVDSDDFKGLLTYDYETFNEIKRTTFFHNVEDVEYIDDEYGRLQTIFVSGGTGQIAVYLRELIPEGYNQPGADLDGDTIPDNLDFDDDGDGIIDEWDDDIGCESPSGTPCSRYPDISKIRHVEIEIGDTFMISDSFTLPTEDSSHIRNLSRISLAADQVLSANEAELFASAMCANMDHDEIIEQWRDSISLSNGELGEGTVNCILESGMELMKEGDWITQIKISLVISFTYETKIVYPLEISLDEQPLPTDGSISWLAPAHPMSVSFAGDDAISMQIPLWWNTGDNIAKVTMEGIDIIEPTLLEKMVSWAIHPISLVFYLSLCTIGILLLVRRENAIDLDIYDSDDEIYDEEGEGVLDETEDFSDEYEDEIETEQPTVRPTRTPPARKRKMYTATAESTSLTKKRQVVQKSEPNSDEPILKKKRKRLDSVLPTTPVVTKRKVTAPVEKTVKTRRVKINDGDQTSQEIEVDNETEVPVSKEDTPEKKKKRKPVKRKNKSSSEKKFDEKKLQKELVSEFLSDD